jgi:monoterpene epsilon-lactone hydrolase
MSNAEIDVIRAQLAASPRPTDMAGRRARINALGSHYKLPADVRVEPAKANGVAAEWTMTPEADASRVLMFLHGGGYVRPRIIPRLRGSAGSSEGLAFLFPEAC